MAFSLQFGLLPQEVEISPDDYYFFYTSISYRFKWLEVSESVCYNFFQPVFGINSWSFCWLSNLYSKFHNVFGNNFLKYFPNEISKEDQSFVQKIRTKRVYLTEVQNWYEFNDSRLIQIFNDAVLESFLFVEK